MGDAVAGRSTAPPPRPLSRFVGRRTELDELARLLATNRLLTLTGPGGCGKTRLALELAAEMRPRFPDGVAFVDLAKVREAGMVGGAVTEAVGLSPEAAGSLEQSLANAAMLILVDNAEHLVDEVARLVQDLLRTSLELTVVVTSRELLNVPGEVSWRVPSLSLPPAGETLSVDRLAPYDAVQLFCARASELAPGFTLTAENARAVADICRRLDGIPLALELAAGRVRSLPLAEIVSRLDDAVRLLAGGSRAAVARHQTLRAALDWSYELLEAPGRVLFGRLTLFADTFDLEAARSVCAGPDLDADGIPDTLGGLVDKSLVTTHRAEDGSLRYSLLEAVRQYGREKLAASEGDREEAHARYYARLVRRLANTEPVRGSSRLLAADYENVRLALDWAAVHDPDLEVRMLDGLAWFWRARGDVREALPHLQAALDRGIADPRDHASLLCEAAIWAFRTGDVAAATVLGESAFALRGSFEDAVVTGRLHQMRGILRAEAGDLEGAEQDFAAGLRATGAEPSALSVLWANNLAMARLLLGRPQEALGDIELALDILKRLGGDPAPEVYHTLGSILLALGRGEEARAQFLQGLEAAAADANYRSAIAHLEGLARVSATHDPDLSMTLQGAAAYYRRLVGAGRLVHQDAAAAEAENVSRRLLGAARAAAAFSRGLQLGLHGAHDLARAGAAPGAELTARKREIASLVADGLSNKEIARRLSISERTVDAHLDQLRTQLGLHNRAQVAVWATQLAAADRDQAATRMPR